MFTLYLICATLGGTVLVVQFLLTVIGIGGDDFDADVDIPDDSDFLGEAHTSVADHGSTWLFSVISLKTIVAALAFFGLAGCAGLSAKLPTLTTLVIAIACGTSAMFLVHYLVKSLNRLDQDSSLHLNRSLEGKRGTVYVAIPAAKTGEGKIQLKLQNRIEEIKAMTEESEQLPTGARVVISRMLTPTTVEVELLREPPRKPKATEMRQA